MNMRRTIYTLVLAALLTGGTLSAQNYVRQTKVATQAQMRTDKIIRNYDAQSDFIDHPIIESRTPGANAHSYTPPTTGKVHAATPTTLGTSDNAFTAIRGQQNQTIADPLTGIVAFIHRQDLSIWGGNPEDNGRYRYDISTDGGLTWALDLGYLQQTFTNYGRYPNLTLANPTSSTNPFDAKLVWGGATNRFPTPGWIGHNYGVADVVATSGAAANSTEHYLFDTEQTLLPGSLVEGLPGEFWITENQYDGTDITDSIRIMKGIWNTNTSDVDWAVAHTIAPGYDKTFDGTAYGSTPIIGFSPDGMTGWIAQTGNFTSGTDTRQGTILPSFTKSTDGGATWGANYEVNLNDISWIQDSLQSLWVDSMNMPAASGLAFCLFRNHDIVVDKDGNPHFGTVVYSAATTDDYFFQPGFAKFLADVYSTDGGATWDASYISPILTYDNDFGSGQTVNMANFTQVSRTDDGKFIFFSWADSDTSQFTGSQNGIGFGEIANLSPNLRIASKRVSDGGQTYPQTISDGDLTWEGRMLFPNMSPITHSVAGDWHLPIVALDLLQGDGGLQTGFFYWGNDAAIPTNSTFCQWESMDLGWSTWGNPSFDPTNAGCVVNVNTQTESAIVLYQSAPNPNYGQAVIKFELPAITNVTLDLVNMYGQQVATLATGEYNAGLHNVTVHTEELAAGVYFYNLRAGDEVITKKMVVTK
jgi:hypothetical protein